MNNEPVAWLSNDSFEISTMQSDKFSIPLYTHPSEHDLGIADAIGFERGYKAATVKELTDEEIRAIHEQTDGNLNMIEFARAILKKAQEK